MSVKHTQQEPSSGAVKIQEKHHKNNPDITVHMMNSLWLTETVWPRTSVNFTELSFTYMYIQNISSTRGKQRKSGRGQWCQSCSSGTQAVMPCNTQTQRWKGWINEAGKKRCIIWKRCLQRCMICKKWLQAKMLRDAGVNWNWNSSPISKQYNPTSTTDQCLKHYVTVYQCPLNSFDY